MRQVYFVYYLFILSALLMRIKPRHNLLRIRRRRILCVPALAIQHFTRLGIEAKLFIPGIQPNVAIVADQIFSSLPELLLMQLTSTIQTGARRDALLFDGYALLLSLTKSLEQ